MLENFGLRVLTEHPYRIASARQPPIWIQDFELAHARRRHARSRSRWRRSRKRSSRPGTAARERRLQPAAARRRLTGAKPWCCAPTAATCCRPASRSASVHGARAVAQASIAQRLARLFETQFDPALEAPRRATPQRPRSRREIRALDKVTSLDEDRILRASARDRATLRTNYYQSDATGATRAGCPSSSIRAHPRAAAAAARRSRSSSTPRASKACTCAWVRGARRHPLVRPPRGFPHRSARPDEGAERQEHRHRAGGRQGRLRAQAPAGQCEPRRRAARRRRVLPDVHPRPARHHRQHRQRQGRAARAGRAPRRRRSVSRGRRRQGHRDVLRHRQRASPPNTASGWATPSPPAARPATTTRGWASPRAAPGNASSAISASSASTPSRRTSPAPASATCRATCSATACCSRSTSGCWRRSITGTSSSIRIRIRRASFAERERLFALPRSSWDDYDRKLISQGGGVCPRTAKSIPLSPQAQRACSASSASQRTPSR